MVLHKSKQVFLKRLIQRHVVSLDQNQGLTLLETLVAIIVITLTVSAITPAFVLTVATRVQSQKAEQAMQLARDEIDKARVIMELGEVTDANGNPTERANFLPGDVTGVTDPSEVGAPTVFLAADTQSCTDPLQKSALSFNEACAIEIDCDIAQGEDCLDADFAVQTYRVGSFPNSTVGDVVAFDIGVRVYAYDATKDVTDDGSQDVNVQGLSTNLARAGLTTNPRTFENGSYRNAPLAVIYTTITRSEEDESLCDYYEFLDPGVDLAAEGLNCT